MNIAETQDAFGRDCYTVLYDIQYRQLQVTRRTAWLGISLTSVSFLEATAL